jgi:hypothetical protein
MGMHRYRYGFEVAEPMQHHTHFHSVMHAREQLVPHLSLLFHATNTLEYYPQEWSLIEMLILKKPGKPNYTSPSAWQPIVLSDGMAQLLNSCQAEDMIMMCEKFNILPANHLGARLG